MQWESFPKSGIGQSQLDRGALPRARLIVISESVFVVKYYF
jgi:hypothetical protein